MLKVLFVEDSEDDTLLELDALESAGYDVVWKRVQTAPAMEQHLRDEDWDVILCDYCMPSFDAPSALRILKTSSKHIPLIIVSGTVGEDVAVESLQLGAGDYLLKQNLTRLVPAVERCLIDTKNRHQRTAHEQQIREQAALLDKAHDAIFVTDLSGNILYWNKGAEHLYGWTAIEITGQNAPSLLIIDSGQIKDAWNIIRTKGDWSGELHDQTKDGRKIIVESRWTLLKDNHNHPQSILVINTDITEKKSLQAQIIHTQKLESIGTLASGIAHDFNNLLTIINGHAEMSLLGMDSSDPKRNTLQAIHDAGRRAASLTSQLLAFSRKSMIEPTEIQLNEIISNLEKMLQRLIGEDIHLSVETDPQLPLIRSDVTHIEQIIMNLIVNARDAMPSGGNILIRTSQAVLDDSLLPETSGISTNDHVLLEITDTGAGIPDHIKERIFEPFFTTKDAGKGTGLGLSTVYGIIRQSNGHILVESAVGKGTTFQIYLPACSKAPTTPSPSPLPTYLPRGTETVLLIEDDPSVRKLITMILESLGYAVIEAPNAEASLDIARGPHRKIDLLLTDVIMPGMNGCELAKAITDKYPGLPVLFTSGYTSHAILEEKILKTGAHFLQKPFSAQTLAKKVREALE